ncbi:Cell wall hydrolase/autolysin, catalytic domain protein, partial [Candidatus Magnetoovum chiemensis]
CFADCSGVFTAVSWVYYDKEAIKVAARENAISVNKMQLAQTELGVILASLEREIKRDESLRLAHFIQENLVSDVSKSKIYKGDVRDLGVKQALFYVLVGASMPCALVEMSFITNPQEEDLLKKNTYKLLIAKSIAFGINKYLSSLPDTANYVKAYDNKKNKEN